MEIYESLITKCMEISNIFDSHSIADSPHIFFDPQEHVIDDHAQFILETFTEIKDSNLKAIGIEGDGNCIFTVFILLIHS